MKVASELKKKKKSYLIFLHMLHAKPVNYIKFLILNKLSS